MRHYVSIANISTPSITRDRGKQAAKILLNHMKYRNIDIDLSTTDVVSLSFLDELVCHFTDKVNKGNIVFVTDDEFTMDKLSIISGTRDIAIYCRSMQDADAHVVPISKSINLLSKSVLATSKTYP